MRKGLDLLPSIIVLIVCALADLLLTLQSISHHGLAIEGNYLLWLLMVYVGNIPGLLIAKGSTIISATYVAYKMNQQNYKIRGQNLLYGASLVWLYAAVSHCLLIGR